MKKLITLCFLLFFVSGFILAEEKALRPMTTDDALNRARVGGGLISPDSKWVFFTKSELDW